MTMQLLSSDYSEYLSSFLSNFLQLLKRLVSVFHDHFDVKSFSPYHTKMIGFFLHNFCHVVDVVVVVVVRPVRKSNREFLLQ